MTGYRRDIDGLRAVAVVPVVLFHAGAGGLPGGFVGVDVFFVISGFLITSIIHREITAGTFSILRFYERRARRILPALFAVTAAVLAAGYVLLMPAEFEDAARAALAAAVFLSNILFWSETGYFSPGIYDQPLLHTWSLAIEEQFYIIFPPLMMLLAALRRGPVRLIAALTLLSFGLSALTTQMRPDMAYYLLPWRAWELGAGALTALLIAGLRLGRLAREAMGLGGLAMIAYAVVRFDEATVFPGAAAMLPVAGAAMIIAAGGQAGTVCDRILSLRPVVWIGLISYSLYLWHWPVIVFYQQITLDRPDTAGCILVAALSTVLAWASWKYVETPFRRPPAQRAAGHAPSSARVLATALGGIAAAAAVSAAVLAGNGFPSRLPPEAVRLAGFAADRHPRLRECTARDSVWRPPGTPCLFGPETAGPATVAIWGDSHAAALLPEAEAAAQRSGRRLAYLSRSGCLPVPETERLDGQTGRCAEYGNGALAYLTGTDTIETVILVSRYAMAAEGYLVDYGLAERDWGPTLFADTGTGSWPEDQRLERLIAKLSTTVARLRGAGRQVAIVYPIPEIGHKVPETLAKLVLHGRDPEAFGLARSEYDRRNTAVIAALDRITAQHGATRILPQDALCGANRCRVIQDGTPLYYDDDHLNSAGAALLGAAFDAVMAPPHIEARAAEGNR
ncbi:acyltransferase (plasmid) [Leisingera sp. M527]|uniref:acyltransferase family protein n=1 Tax=Leisingera sp. M527 TaxID=2867014 RepID=UPI0021A68615|nr:acyltransferase family protein [Leisingera sp. M527]UWQ35128.1 acyltransferase [Leisingera sp. M527]